MLEAGLLARTDGFTLEVLMKRLALLLLTVLPASSTAFAEVKADPLGIAGVWNLTSTFERSTCPAPNDQGGTQAFQWIISAQADGSYTVSVQGETVFPKLAGRAVEGRLLLTGLERNGVLEEGLKIGVLAGSPQVAYKFARSDFHIELKDGALVGRRVTTLVDGPVKAGRAGGDVDLVYFAPCSVESGVKAKRQ